MEFCYLALVGESYDVFISYNRADGSDRVRLLKEKIQREGFSIWMDEKIEPSADFERKIEAALTDSGCVVVAWTQGAVASDWVRAEAKRGHKKDRLISVLLDDVEVPLPYNIRDIVDLTNWPPAQRDADSPELRRLLDGITALLGRKPPTTPSRPAKEETFTTRVAKRVAEEVRRIKEEEPVLPREEQLRDLLPGAVYERLTHANALIDQMSRESLSRAGNLARDVVGETANRRMDERGSLDDGRVALLRSHYLSVLLGGHGGSDQIGADGALATALSSGDPQQVDAALVERMGEPEDQSLFLFALYVLFPAGDIERGQKFLKAASSINPLSAEIKFHRGRARELLGKRSSCLRFLRDTLRMSPNAELAVVYQTPVFLRSGKNAAARANLEIHGDSLAEPIRTILEDIVTQRSIDRARMLQAHLDAALNTLKLPVRPLADAFTNPTSRGVEPLPLSQGWLDDVAKRADGYLKSVSSRTLGRQ